MGSLRITPAGAGKTRFVRNRRQRNRDHPRRCGENSPMRIVGTLSLGSPPQVRGKLDTPMEETETDRITPAGAGKTINGRLSSESEEDHPRRCGENVVAFSTTPLMVGSPPQVRGKHSGTVFAPCITRITPAGAGKTKIKPTYRPDKTDHPRRCGENDTIISWTAKEIGSPPQVRGKQCGQSLLRCTPGITPAGAGKTICPILQQGRE